MERAESWGGESVIKQLNHGIKLTNKLKKQLHHHSNSTECGFLIHSIVSCYDNALAMLNYMDSLQTGDSTTSFDFSPTSHEVSDQDFKNHIPKKRKSLDRWSEEVHVCCGTRSEDQHEDGYNWRKYGQKDILGATHPRSYYRCTYRNTQGCLATKQLQREEDNASILKIVYKGKHSCGLKQTKENVIAETNDESKHESAAAAPLILLEPTSTSTCHPNNFKIDHSFLDSESSFPLGDLDFFIDFDAPLFELSFDYFSTVQESKN